MTHHTDPDAVVTATIGLTEREVRALSFAVDYARKANTLPPVSNQFRDNAFRIAESAVEKIAARFLPR